MGSSSVEGFLGAAGFPWQVSHILLTVPIITFLLIPSLPRPLFQMTLDIMAHFSSSSHLWICNAITPAKSPLPLTDTFKAYRAENQGIIGSCYSAPWMNTGGILMSPQVYRARCLFVQSLVLSPSYCGFHRNRTMAVTCC